MSKKNPHYLLNYTAKSTFIHSLSASTKMIALFLISISSYFMQPIVFLILFTSLCCISLISKFSLSSYLLMFKIILYYSVLILLFRLTGKPVHIDIYVNEIKLSLLYIGTLTIVLFAGTIFYETTSATDIRYSLAQIFKSKKNTLDISLLFSLTILFIPRIFQTWTSFERAWMARGGRKKSMFNAWRMITILIPLFLMKLFSYANDTDRAIRHRSF